ncbi:MAG: hypothetical protein Kow001_00350 [Acidobacteriota bacterium]
MNLRTRAAFWLALTFLVGALLGGGLHQLWLESSTADARPDRKPPSPEELVAHLNREAELNLTPDQVVKLQDIFRQRGEQLDREAQRSRDEVRRIRMEAHEQIRGVLSAEQFERFERFKQEWRKRHPRREEPPRDATPR